MFKFYYDESEHSRKLNLKTLTADEFYDGFVAVVVGWDEADEVDIEKAYFGFEQKYRSPGSKELKSTVLPKKQLEFGFRSLTKANTRLVGDLLDLLSDERIHVYLFYSSKVERLLIQLIARYRRNPRINTDLLLYSLTKLLVQYRPQNVVNALYGDPDKLLDELRSFLDERIGRNEANPELKRTETEQCARIRAFLDEVEPIGILDWCYEPPFDGFACYLSERWDRIDGWNLFVDREEKTAEAAKRCGFDAVRQVDSQDFFGVRMADMLAGVAAKLMKAIRQELTYDSSDDELRKNLFDNRWFDIDDARLGLYKKLRQVLLSNDNSWYKIYAGVYSDDLVVMISLLNFFDGVFASAQGNAEGRNWSEEFNLLCCLSLYQHFQRSAIDTCDHGAGAFHPRLLIAEEPVVKKVVSVGFGENGEPVAVVRHDGARVQCILPEGFEGWVRTLVETGCDAIVLPSDVRFQIVDGRCVADIL